MRRVAEGEHRLRVVTPRFGEAVVGGAEWVARELALRLAGSGWAVEVWTTCAVDAVSWRNQEPAGTSADGPLTVRRFPTPAAPPSATLPPAQPGGVPTSPRGCVPSGSG